ARARARGLEVAASVSINHLCFNEIDIGDYRTFYRLDPPLRPESDRQALIEAVRDGLIDAITSAHAPAPAEDKRRPFAEATPGAVGLETLLPAALTLHHEDGLALLDILRPLTQGPATLLGLDAGVLAVGAPADLILFDPGAPVVVEADKLKSKSKNSPFDGRRLQGKIRSTWVSGRRVFEG
ncbi:MAG: amidohydrolase family protein, partial [Brevundimonas sp.]